MILLAMLGVAWVVPAREFPPSDAVAVLLFGVGAWSAILVTRLRAAVLPDRLASTIVAGAMLFILLRVHNTYTVQAVVPLGVAFFLIANGCTLFGLLTTRAARRVGDLSYPVYLTHGLVLAALMHVPRLEIATTHSTASYMGVRLLAAMLVLGVSGTVHVWVEKPGITLGRAVAARLSAASHSGAVRARPLARASCRHRPARADRRRRGRADSRPARPSRSSQSAATLPSDTPGRSTATWIACATTSTTTPLASVRP